MLDQNRRHKNDISTNKMLSESGVEVVRRDYLHVGISGKVN